jgi:hypothetical protein
MPRLLQPRLLNPAPNNMNTEGACIVETHRHNQLEKTKSPNTPNLMRFAANQRLLQ